MIPATAMLAAGTALAVRRGTGGQLSLTLSSRSGLTPFVPAGVHDPLRENANLGPVGIGARRISREFVRLGLDTRMHG